MYERFTDRARKVMQLANQEARRLNHAQLETEHVLIGLIEEAGGIAGTVLRGRISLLDARTVAGRLHPRRGGIIFRSVCPLSDRVEALLVLAAEVADLLGHGKVGTEHLLLALLQTWRCIAAQVLMNLGLKLEEVRDEVLNLLGHGPTLENEIDKDTRWRVSMQWTDVPRVRKWGVSAFWMGWWRVLTVGVALNFAAPGATLWLAGWNMMIGRIPRAPKTISMEIPDRIDVDGEPIATPSGTQSKAERKGE